jgi:1-acyl-sn-glycerol-3-phosphate acyltransferase
MTSALATRTSPRYYFLLRRFFKLLGGLLLKQKVVGQENIPAEGGFIMVFNHLSIFDPPVLFINAPRQIVPFIADKWRHTPGISHLVNSVGVIWISRGEADMDAIKASLGVLKSGGALGLAPEGTRSHTGQLQKAKTGAAYFADRAGVPILPVALTGTENVWRNLKRLRRTPVSCIVGQPFRLPSDGRAKGDKLTELTDEIMCRIAALLPPQYRGAYAEHPRLKELLALAA